MRRVVHIVTFPAILAINQNRGLSLAVVNGESGRISGTSIGQDAKQSKGIYLDNGDIRPLRNIIVDQEGKCEPGPVHGYRYDLSVRRERGWAMHSLETWEMSTLGKNKAVDRLRLHIHAPDGGALPE
jgi:hypothetical protein